MILFVVMSGWNAPFQYRLRQAPLRNLHANTEFQYPDYRATEEEQNRVSRNFRCYYSNDSQQLEQLRNALTEDLFLVTQKEFTEAKQSGVWAKFYPLAATETAVPAPTAKVQPVQETKSAEKDQAAPADDEAENKDSSEGDPEAKKETVEPIIVSPAEIAFAEFREAVAADEKLEKLRAAITKAFIDIDRNGLLKGLGHEIGEGNLQEIEVFQTGNFAGGTRVVEVSEVRIAEIIDVLKKNLIKEISVEAEVIKQPDVVAERIFEWLKPQLPVTLTWDETRTKQDARKARIAVEQKFKTIAPGDVLESERVSTDSRFIHAGIPLNEEDIKLLTAEHSARSQAESGWTKVIRSVCFFGLNAAMFLMIAQYLYFRDPYLLENVRQFSILLALMLVTLTTAWLLTINGEWRSEIVPIAMFAMIIAIAYHIELALLLGALVSFAFSVAHGYGLAEFVILCAASSSAALMCRQIRSRTKLVSVGFVVAVVVFPTALGVNYMLGQPIGWALATDATWFAGGAAIAGLLMTGVLPFLERLFDIQTDISLLELSDANHPLLKELVQRAPGTYNHSINVASMSEAAADAIGANGLLCRVGAYFHDVGKLRKPDYFIENQGGGVNKHDDLTPTMSTLVIIAHVKDGAEIARKHRLPRRIIDLIEQHHGTTMVEYFYRRAEQQLIEQKEAGEEDVVLDEAEFRYPGPRPQTPEAAVMMLADTVESASRALREPAPARIESLVKEIAKKKFDDGQFDECHITIEQLHTIEGSLVKSLNAMYHARVKYPEKQLA